MSYLIVIDTVPSQLGNLNFDTLCDEVVRLPCVVSALEAARERLPALIVTVESPEGLEAKDLLELKQLDPSLAQIPTMIVSSSARNKIELLRAGCDDFALLPIPQEELTLRLRTLLRQKRVGGVRGDLSHLNALDLIQMLVAARRTGKLEIDCYGLAGELQLIGGQVTHAVCPGFLGEEAFLQLLQEAKSGGTFCFTAAILDETESNISRPTNHLLLEFANRLDEAEQLV